MFWKHTGTVEAGGGVCSGQRCACPHARSRFSEPGRSARGRSPLTRLLVYISCRVVWQGVRYVNASVLLGLTSAGLGKEGERRRREVELAGKGYPGEPRRCLWD